MLYRFFIKKKIILKHCAEMSRRKHLWSLLLLVISFAVANCYRRGGSPEFDLHRPGRGRQGTERDFHPNVSWTLLTFTNDEILAESSSVITKYQFHLHFLEIKIFATSISLIDLPFLTLKHS